MKRQTTVQFDEIFHYAEKHHGIDWNKCNDVFFDHVFPYKGSREIYLEDIEYELTEEANSGFSKDQKMAREAMAGFMKSKKLKKVLVLGA